MELLFYAGILTLGSLWYYRRLSGAPHDPPMPVERFGRPDAILAVLLSFWFLANLLAASDTPALVSVNVLVINAVFAFLLLTGLASFLILRGLNPLILFGLSMAGWQRSRSVLLPAFLMALPAIYFVHAVGTLYFGEVPQPILEFLLDSQNLRGRLLLVFTAVVVAPLSEELIFRGFLYGVLRRYGGRVPALVLNAVLFAAIHNHLPAMGGLFVLAIALTIVYEKTASLWAPILVHAGFNALTVATAVLWPHLMR